MFKRRAKIVVTLGPATDSPKVLERLIGAGLDVARLNMSHGTWAGHKQRIRLIRRLAKKHNRPVAVLLDLSGPKMRTGLLKNNRLVPLVPKRRITITTQSVIGDAAKISTTYKHLPQDVKRGDPILLDDGKIRLEVVSKRKREVACRVVVGGWLKEHAGLNLPGTALSSTAITAKDLGDLRMGIKLGIDAVALSFVRRANDVLRLKKMMRRRHFYAPVIAKIERVEAIDRLEDILKVTEGVMVARGDLGVEATIEKVPILQKRIIDKANAYSVVAVTATQMLETMVKEATPTRAEASDVANAVFDGTDAVMLSAETATGRYPVETVKTMARIIEEAEKGLYRRRQDHDYHYPDHSLVHAVVHAACHAAEEVQAKAIMVFSMSGTTARLLSKLKPKQPIIALTPKEQTYNQLALFWGVIPVLSPLGHSTDEMIAIAGRKVRAARLLKRGDKVVVVSGTQQLMGATNMMKILTL
ncbi:MAG: pyruvate kinase [Deltaproteobacteria bacterium]|nr:pyruvate kinase [Deltaproteobacteria bacterium]MBI4223986.1 pyruvate kinase [Deltaproteobacteria bacterium]